MNTTEFLDACKRNITVPTYQPRFDNDDLLALAFEEQKTMIVPMLLGVGENYLLYEDDVELDAGEWEIPFPYRAIARAVKDVWYNDATNQPRELIRLQVSRTATFLPELIGTPVNFTVYSDKIKIYPRPQQAATLKFLYYINPSKPVAVSRAAQITAIGVDTLTLTKIPSNFTVSSPVDVTKVQAGYNILYMDKTITNISGLTITLGGFSALDPITSLTVGDWVSTAQETAILQLPNEVQDVLVQAVAVRVLEALGVPDQLEMAQKQFDKRKEAVMLLMAPRVEDQPEIIFNGHPLIGNRNYALGIPSVVV